MKSNIRYDILDDFKKSYLQAADIRLKNNKIAIYSVYFPPRHNIKYQVFFLKLGHSFLVGGDFNAKHPWWGSRLSNPKGKELYKSIINNKFSVLSTTYWPSEARKIPDLLDFVIYSGIPSNLLNILDTDDLSSDCNHDKC